MQGAFLRSHGMPGYSPGALRGAGRVRGQPYPGQTQGQKKAALLLALLLACTRATLRWLVTACEQAGRIAPSLSLVITLVCVFQLMYPLWTQFDQPLTQVQIIAGPQPVNTQPVRQRLASLLEEGGFFSLDLDAVRQELESQPLIASVHLHKRWPQQLVAELTMRQPLMRWGEQELLMENGELLSSGAEHYAHLPQLVGPSGSQRQLLARYHEMAEMLHPLGLAVTRLQQQERGSGLLLAKVAASGNTIEFVLGSDDWSGKMQRFIQFAGQPGLALDRLSRVDLRHRNGFAVTPIRQEQPGSQPIMSSTGQIKERGERHAHDG